MGDRLRRIVLILFAMGTPPAAITALIVERTGIDETTVSTHVEESYGRVEKRDPSTLRTRYVSVYATNASLAAAATDFALGYCKPLSLEPALADKYADCLVAQEKSLTEGRTVCTLAGLTPVGRVAMGVRLTQYQLDSILEARTAPVQGISHAVGPGDADAAHADVEAALAAASRRWCP